MYLCTICNNSILPIEPLSKTFPTCHISMYCLLNLLMVLLWQNDTPESLCPIFNFKKDTSYFETTRGYGSILLQQYECIQNDSMIQLLPALLVII